MLLKNSLTPEAFGYLTHLGFRISGEGNNHFATQLESLTYLVRFSIKNIKTMLLYINIKGILI